MAIMPEAESFLPLTAHGDLYGSEAVGSDETAPNARPDGHEPSDQAANTPQTGSRPVLGI